MVEQQRRGRAIAMSADEVDSYLAEQRTCRVATVGHDGRPHVSALWFVWDGADLWLNSLSKSQRWTDLRRDPRVAVVIDDGIEFLDLRGVELSGRVEVVGEVPRTAEPNDVLAPVEAAFAAKSQPDYGFHPDGRTPSPPLAPAQVAPRGVP